MSMLDSEERRDVVLAVDVNNCPLCEQTGRRLYSELRDRLFDAPGIWSIMWCAGCKHAWLNPRPLREGILRLYRTYYTKGSTTPSIKLQTPILEFLRRSLLYSMGYKDTSGTNLGKLVSRVLWGIPLARDTIRSHYMYLEGPASGKLLDAGCGNGSQLMLMSDLGWDVVGLEPDPVAAELAGRRSGSPIFNEFLEAKVFDDETFRVILMDHVIEHTLDPMRALTNCRSYLSTGGRLVIRTPNLLSRGHSFFGSNWVHLDPPRHVNIFSVASLQACVQRAGLEVLVATTSARAAPQTYDVSCRIRKLSKDPLRETGSVHTLKGYMFRHSESASLRSNPEVGEEIVLIAKRG